MESQESLLFNHMLTVKIRPAIPKPWQVEHEINNKIGVTFFCQILPTSCCLTRYNFNTATQMFICSIPSQRGDSQLSIDI